MPTGTRVRSKRASRATTPKTKARAVAAASGSRVRRPRKSTSASGGAKLEDGRVARKKATRAKTRARSPAALRTYREKRDFTLTPEPSGAERARKKPAQGPIFVVQKHAARNLHYDFRLQLDGVLLSWSVPKGPSLKTDEKRLAVRTEDHPLDYADFEGIIPKGQYGGGTVIVWDHGWWSSDDPQAGMKKGHLAFELHGEKLSGRFHLVRTRSDKSKRENWLLFKGHDASEAKGNAREIVEARPESSLTGRSIEEVAQAPTRVWRSNRAEEQGAPEKKAAKGRTGSGATPPTDVANLLKNLGIGVKFTNLDKLLYPERNLRKAEVIAYFASVAGVMMPHVRGRPLTLVRCPDGPGGECWYQKHANKGVPHAVQRVEIAERDNKREPYLAVNDVAGLLALPQLGALEIHTWPCHVDRVEAPDQLIFDLDPAEDVRFEVVVDAALELRERLSELGLQSLVKTTGGKGLHVVAPVKRQLDWESHKAFAFGVAEAMAKDSPKRFLTNSRKDLRKGRVYLDYLRNGRGATAVAPYSTRAREGAPVATPLSWDELTPDLEPRRFDLSRVLSRVNQVDPWREYSKLAGQVISKQALRRAGVKV